MRQVRVDFETYITVLSVRSVVNRPKDIGRTLDITLGESFVNRDWTSSVKCHLANVTIIVFTPSNRLFEDRRVRSHPAKPIFLDQLAKLAGGDKIAPCVIQPDGLSKRLKFSQSVLFHIFLPLFKPPFEIFRAE